MKRLVHIRFWRRNIVLETSRNRSEHFVYHSKHVIAIGNRIYNYSNCVNIINFLKLLTLHIHLSVYAVNGFYSSLDGKIGYAFVKLFAEQILYAFDVAEAVFLIFFKLTFDIGIGNRVEVFNSEVLELLLYRSNTESVCNRCINFESFARFVELF